jgi:putative tryptophan/tyrosine transport system substrate-binding protein
MFGMRRREFITLLGGAAASWPLAARAQQSSRVQRIGVLMSSTESDTEYQNFVKIFVRRLHELGWTEGQNLRIDYRWAAADTERTRVFAKELVDLQPDLIVSQNTPTTAALLQETRTIPIVFCVVSDPVGSGFVTSLAHPAGNVTGFTNFESSMSSKWLDLLKQIMPRLSRAALMFNPEMSPYQYYWRAFQSAAAAFGVQPVEAAVHDVAEIERAFLGLAREPPAGLVLMPDVFNLVHRELIISLSARYRVPTLYFYRYLAAAGGLISYGIDIGDLFQRAAPYVDRILKGEKPGELPVQAPTRFEFVINLKTAKTLGLDIPPTLLALADEVIE